MRLVMNQDRLNDFLILSSEKELSDSIDLAQLCVVGQYFLKRSVL